MKKFSSSFLGALNTDLRHYFFSKTGYSLHRKGETSGKILEFVGTSGVGKTTIFRKCVYDLRKRWFFAYQLDSVKRKFPPGEAEQIFMLILKSKLEKIYNSTSYCPWHSFMDLVLSVRVVHNSMLVSGNDHPLGFVFDEGLFRHFAAEILELGDEFPGELWRNRAFVYVRARQPETVLLRYKARRMAADQSKSFRIRTDDELLSQVLQEQANFQTIVDMAASFGCSTIIIDAENSIQDSVNKVCDFERSVCHRLRD